MININTKTLKQSLHGLKIMLRADFEQARGTFAAKLIDRFIWMMTLMLVAAYLLPIMGMSSSFGKLMLAGLIPSIGIIDSYSAIALLVSDLDGDRVITYYLTLPIPASLVFIRLLIYNALFFTGLCLVLFPICNIFLPEPIAYSSIHWAKFLSILLLTNFLHGAIILWATTYVSDMRMLGKIWSRLLHPLWFLGGFQFTWTAVNQKSSILSYVMLCNPIVYATEGVRGALLAGTPFLSFWLCASALSIITVGLTAHALARFKKRLDLV